MKWTGVILLTFVRWGHPVFVKNKDKITGSHVENSWTFFAGNSAYPDKGFTDHIDPDQDTDVAMKAIIQQIRPELQVIEALYAEEEKKSKFSKNVIVKGRFFYTKTDFGDHQVMTKIDPIEELYNLIDPKGIEKDNQYLTVVLKENTLEIRHFGPFGPGKFDAIRDNAIKEAETKAESSATEAEQAATDAEKTKNADLVHCQKARTAADAAACAVTELKAEKALQTPWTQKLERIRNLAVTAIKYSDIAKRMSNNAKPLAKSEPGPRPLLGAWKVRAAPSESSGRDRMKRSSSISSTTPSSSSTSPSVSSDTTLSVNLELIDSDPGSEFVIAKIIFKEKYSAGEETHIIDFETNKLIEDKSSEGSKLQAEVLIDCQFKPVKTEKSTEGKQIRIVLTPRA